MLPVEVQRELAVLVATGFESRASVLARLVDTMWEELGLPEDARLGAAEGEGDASALALGQAIDDAFARHAQEERTWGEQTDCDRLSRAFDVLNEQGIVALQNCGATIDDGVQEAVAIAIARDELGARVHDGYCFFHEQDVRRAIEEGGLWLAFGSFEDEAGAGATRPRSAQAIGASIAQACRDAGLEVAWSGSPGQRIQICGFRWQRRLRTAAGLEIDAFLASWELELRAGYTPVSEAFEVLAERGEDALSGYSDYGPALIARLREHTIRFLAAEQARESTWNEATINDRLTAAFAELGERGVLALEGCGLTIQDGWGYAGLSATAAHRGVVFFHREDVVDALDGRGLWLAFGALPVDDPRDAQASAALASEVIDVLSQHGVACSWGGSVRERIRVQPFAWQRRRWTSAPAHDRSPPVVRETPSWWARTFGRARAAKAPPVISPDVRRFAEVVRAARDERAFDRARSSRMRAAWASLGLAGEGQVGHLGLPHVFVRAGEYTSVLPVATRVNLCEEREAIFRRAASAVADDGDEADRS